MIKRDREDEGATNTSMVPGVGAADVSQHECVCTLHQHLHRSPVQDATPPHM